MSRSSVRVPVVFLLALFVPAASFADGVGWRGWGPRAGLSSDPDQVVGGVQFDLGEFASHVRFQPSVDIGVGDHTTTVSGNLMVSYYFPVQAKVTPYAGGSLTATYFNFDQNCRGFAASIARRGRCDDSDTEIAPAGVGGIEMKLSGKVRFLAELQVGFADLPETKVVAGWIF